MKKNIIHVLWMALAVCATSCNDLDEVVYSSVTEQTYSYSVNDFILLHRDSTEFHRLG